MKLVKQANGWNTTGDGAGLLHAFDSAASPKKFFTSGRISEGYDGCTFGMACIVRELCVWADCTTVGVDCVFVDPGDLTAIGRHPFTGSSKSTSQYSKGDFLACTVGITVTTEFPQPPLVLRFPKFREVPSHLVFPSTYPSKITATLLLVFTCIANCASLLSTSAHTQENERSPALVRNR